MRIEVNPGRLSVVSNYELKHDEIVIEGVKYNLKDVATLLERVKDGRL